MKEKPRRDSHVLPQSARAETSASTSHELLKIYLSLPKKQREERFADTARAAEITGLSRRTMQFWIEIGAVRAISIGKKCEIDLDSLIEYLSSRIED